MCIRDSFLYLTEFFAGMSVMAVELGASRLMAPYFSSSQIVWTVIIGVIMIAMAIGNVWGGWAVENIGYQPMYLAGGCLVLVSTLLFSLYSRRQSQKKGLNHT